MQYTQSLGASRVFEPTAVGPHVASVLTGARTQPWPDEDGLPDLAGRIVEISAAPASGTTSLLCSWVARAQRQKEPVAWIQSPPTSLFPPDLQAAGVDLNNLIVVHTSRMRSSIDVMRAAELLLDGGGFGLVILDLGASMSALPVAGQSRLLALARQYRAAVIVINEAQASMPSSGPLVSLRLQPRYRLLAPPAEGQAQADFGHVFALEIDVLKNKFGAPMWPWQQQCRGPHGLW